MSASQGCIDDKAVVESFKEALKGRIGEDRYRMWFSQGVEFEFGELLTEPSQENTSGPSLRLQVNVRGQFALDRLRQHFLQPLRGAAMQACGRRVEVQLCLLQPPAEQHELPLGPTDEAVPSNPIPRKRAPAKRKRRGPQTIAALVNEPRETKTANDLQQPHPQQPHLPQQSPAAGHSPPQLSPDAEW